MAEFDSIMADMGVAAPEVRKPTPEELSKIFSGARALSAPEAPAIETDIATVEAPVLEAPVATPPQIATPEIEDLTIPQKLEARKLRMEEARQEKSESAMSRDLERSGIPQATEPEGPGFGRKAFDLVANNTAFDYVGDVAKDIPSDIKEGFQGLGEDLKNRGENIADNLVEADFSDPKSAGMAFVKTAGQLFGGAADTLGAVFMTAIKAGTPEQTERDMKLMMGNAGKNLQEVTNPVTGATLGETIEDISASWEDFSKENPNAAAALEAGGNAAMFALDVVTAGEGSAFLKKTGREALEASVKVTDDVVDLASKIELPKIELPKFKTGVKSVDDVIKTKPTKVAEKLGPKILAEPSVSGQIVQRIHRVLPTDAQKFAERSGKPMGEWLVERGIVDTPEKTMKQLFTRFTKSKNAVDDAFGKIKGTFKDVSLIKAADELVDLERKIAKSGVASKDKKLIENLSKRLKSDGLTMSEVNSLKRLYSRKVKTEYMKDSTKTSVDVQAKTNVEAAIREFQATKATELGFDDLKALNMETSLSKQALDAIGQKYLRSMSNNAISLTDWVVASGSALNPAFLGALIGKKAISSEAVQAFVARQLSRGKTKVGLPKADTTKIIRKSKIMEQRGKFSAKNLTTPKQPPKLKITKKPSPKIVDKAKGTVKPQNIRIAKKGAPAPKVVVKGGPAKVAVKAEPKAIKGKDVGSIYDSKAQAGSAVEFHSDRLKMFEEQVEKLSAKKPSELNGLEKANLKQAKDGARFEKKSLESAKKELEKFGVKDPMADIDFDNPTINKKIIEDKKNLIKNTDPNSPGGAGIIAKAERQIKGLEKKSGPKKKVKITAKKGSSHLPGSTGISDKDVIKKMLVPEKKGEAIILDADKIKALLGSTDKTAPLYHKESSRLVQESFTEALKDVKGKYVDFTAGGSGSGKTEVLIKGKNGIKNDAEIILDGTGAKFDKLEKNIKQVIAEGKTPRLNIVYADKDQAWLFVQARGRAVPRKDFERIHKDFRSSVLRATKENNEVVPIISINSLGSGMGGKRLKFANRDKAIRFMERMSKHETLPKKDL